MDLTLNFLKKWWAVVIIPTTALAYTLYNDWLNNREIFEITGLESLALYDLRSDKGVEVPEFVALLALEITNKSRKPIYISRADCFVDMRATRLVHPTEVLCAAFAGRPQDDYVGFVSDGLANATISNLGRRAASAPVELKAGGIGYATLMFNHNPEPPFPKDQQIRLGMFDTTRWRDEGVRVESTLIHQVLAVKNLDAIYESEDFDRLKDNDIQSYVGADVWLETTNGTRLDPISIVSLVLFEDAAMSLLRSHWPLLDRKLAEEK